MRKSGIYLSMAVLAVACNNPETPQDDQQAIQTEVDSFLTAYTRTYQDLYYTSAKAEWELNTHIVEGDTLTSQMAEMANEAYADFTGSKANIEAAGFGSSTITSVLIFSIMR